MKPSQSQERSPRSRGTAARHGCRLSYVLGLRRLGLDVAFVEQLERSDTRRDRMVRSR